MDTDEIPAAAQPSAGLLVKAQLRHHDQALEATPGDADLEDLQAIGDLLGVLCGTLDLEGEQTGAALLLLL